MIRDKKILAILPVILKAESFYYYTIFDHMTKIYLYIKQNKLLACSKFPLTILSL